jgi:hypothetical protein
LFLIDDVAIHAVKLCVSCAPGDNNPSLKCMSGPQKQPDHLTFGANESKQGIDHAWMREGQGLLGEIAR